MAKAQFKVGADIDFLTEEELSRRLGALQDFFVEFARGQEGETITQAGNSFKTDGSGNTSSLDGGGATVYTVPVGFDAMLVRLTVDYEGSNAASPAACDLRVVADQNTPAGLRALADALPNVYEVSKSHAPLFRGGQHVVVCITGGPHSTTFYATVQVILTRRLAQRHDTLDSEPAAHLELLDRAGPAEQ